MAAVMDMYHIAAPLHAWEHDGAVAFESEPILRRSDVFQRVAGLARALQEMTTRRDCVCVYGASGCRAVVSNLCVREPVGWQCLR